MYSSLEAFSWDEERHSIFGMLFLTSSYTVIVSTFDKVQSFLGIVLLLKVSFRKIFYLSYCDMLCKYIRLIIFPSFLQRFDFSCNNYVFIFIWAETKQANFFFQEIYHLPLKIVF